jgi:hypothetical protein
MKLRNIATGEIIESDSHESLPVGEFMLLTEAAFDMTCLDAEGQTVFVEKKDGTIELGDGYTWETAFKWYVTMQRDVTWRAMARMDEEAFQFARRNAVKTSDTPAR